MAFYKKKQVQEMRPWVEGLPMGLVSVSEADKQNGSPKKGDMIAFSITDPNDRWLVSEQFFKDNYELVAD